MKNILFFILLLISITTFAQERKTLYGRVVSDMENTGIPNVFVINKTTGTETKTDVRGNFHIPAKAGDKLAVYSTNTGVRDFAVPQNAFAENPFIVSVSVKAYELNEVVIEKDTITSESLGLASPDQKRLTPAERKLYTAQSGVDGLINAISGRTKMLKRAVETEKKEKLLEQIDYIYTEEEIITELKIPAEYVGGFLYYIVEDSKFAAAIKAKNYSMAKFIGAGLSKDYLKLIADEK